MGLCSRAILTVIVSPGPKSTASTVFVVIPTRSARTEYRPGRGARNRKDPSASARKRRRSRLPLSTNDTSAEATVVWLPDSTTTPRMTWALASPATRKPSARRATRESTDPVPRPGESKTISSGSKITGEPPRALHLCLRPWSARSHETTDHASRLSYTWTACSGCPPNIRPISFPAWRRGADRSSGSACPGALPTTDSFSAGRP